MRGFDDGPVAKTSPSHSGGASSIPGEKAKVPYASQSKHQNWKQRQNSNSSNKDFKKNGPHQKVF